MKGTVDKDAVLSLLREYAPRAVHHGEICARLGVERSDRDAVLDTLEELASLDLAKEMPGRRFRAVKPREKGLPPTHPHARGGEALEGRLTMHPSAFGFVAADDGGPDVFVPPPAVGGAIHGDRVRVSARPSSRGREGEIVAVLERGLRRVSGALHRAGGSAWIDPDDPRVRGPLTVTGAIPDAAKPGVLVVANIVSYPRTTEQRIEVEIADVLGRAGVTEVEVAKLKLRDGVVEEFPPDVVAEAEKLPREIATLDRRGREDLTGFDLVTIDPDDARDHDDAVWAERTPDGGYRILVAIADVSHYVTEGSHLDAEALVRGCSIYLPDRAIPMLPPQLSSHLASLVPNEDRLTLAVEVDLGPNGAIRKKRFIEGVMRSGARLTYGGAARALGWTETPPAQKEAEQRLPMLQVLADAAQVLRANRTKRGSLNFDLPEPRVKLDTATGEPETVVRQKGDPGVRRAYSVVEEMMLLANEVVAAELSERKLPSIYRVHGLPDEDKLLKFCELAAALGERLTPDEALVPKSLARFVRRIEGKAHAGPLNYLLLRAMQQAIYDTNDIGHFALAAKHYTHFTSPIRRYPDLAVHRVLRGMLRGGEVDPIEQRKKLRHAAIESSRLERRAAGLERDVVDLYRAILMRDRVGEEFDATISGIASHGFYSSLDEPFVDALTPLEVLDDWFEADDLGIRLSGRRTGKHYALGDRIRLRVESVSIERRETIAFPLEGVKERTDDEPYERAPWRGAPKRGSARGDRGAGRGARGGKDSARSERPSGSRAKGSRPAAGGARREKSGSARAGKKPARRKR